MTLLYIILIKKIMYLRKYQSGSNSYIFELRGYGLFKFSFSAYFCFPLNLSNIYSYGFKQN